MMKVIGDPDDKERSFIYLDNALYFEPIEHTIPIHWSGHIMMSKIDEELVERAYNGKPALTMRSCFWILNLSNFLGLLIIYATKQSVTLPPT